MTNPGIAAPLSRSRHDQVLEEASRVQGRAADLLDAIDEALAEAPPPRTGRRPRPTRP